MATYHDLCVEMGSRGQYLTDVIGKCQRHIHAFQGNGKSRIDKYLFQSDTYAASLQRRDLKSEFVESRSTEGVLEWIESRNGGDKSRFPILVDEASGVIKQPNKNHFGLLSDVKACLHKEAENGSLIPWHEAKLNKTEKWARHSDTAILAADSELTSFGTKLSSSSRRIGQANWRTRVEKIWGARCVVTGCIHRRLLRAAHIKRHADSPTQERLDEYNGLILAAHIDAAFEVGLISFADDGRLLVSSHFPKEDMLALNLTCKVILPFVPEKTKKYLAWHRQKHGFGGK